MSAVFLSPRSLSPMHAPMRLPRTCTLSRHPILTPRLQSTYIQICQKPKLLTFEHSHALELRAGAEFVHQHRQKRNVVGTLANLTAARIRSRSCRHCTVLAIQNNVQRLRSIFRLWSAFGFVVCWVFSSQFDSGLHNGRSQNVQNRHLESENSLSFDQPETRPKVRQKDRSQPKSRVHESLSSVMISSLSCIVALSVLTAPRHYSNSELVQSYRKNNRLISMLLCVSLFRFYILLTDDGPVPRHT